jgi:hypothetical protein
MVSPCDPFGVSIRVALPTFSTVLSEVPIRRILAFSTAALTVDSTTWNVGSLAWWSSPRAEKSDFPPLCIQASCAAFSAILAGRT